MDRMNEDGERAIPGRPLVRHGLRRDLGRTRVRLARTQCALQQLSALHRAAMVAARLRPVVLGDCAWPARLCDALGDCGAFSMVMMVRRGAHGQLHVLAHAGRGIGIARPLPPVPARLQRIVRAAWASASVQGDSDPGGAAAVPLRLRGLPIAVLVLQPFVPGGAWKQASSRLCPWPPGVLEHIAELIARGLDDVHEHAALRLERLRERAQARSDALTGLMNRTALAEQVARRLDPMRRDGRGIAVGMVDLDGFKAVNDRYGHATGDRVLGEIASRMVRAVRHMDMVARVGGDEFVIVLDDVAGEAADAQIAPLLARVQRAIEAPIELHAGLTVTVGMSAGIAVCPDDGDNLQRLVAAADAALYRSKASKATRMRAWCYAGERSEVIGPGANAPASAGSAVAHRARPGHAMQRLVEAVRHAPGQLLALIGRHASVRLPDQPEGLSSSVRTDQT